MIIHTVMLAFQERAQGRGRFENTTMIRDGFLALKNETNGFLKMEVNMGDQVTPGNYDLIIVTSHNDRSGLTQYLNNPYVVELMRKFEPLISNKAVIDYEATKLGD